MKARIFSILFWITAFIHLIGETVFTGSDLGLNIRLVTKPLLMIFLVLYYVLSIGKNKTAAQYLIIVGFFFSWLGDINLMMPSVNYAFKDMGKPFFLAGLVSFLITHILYIIAFNKERKAAGTPTILKSKPWLALPTIGLFAGLMYLVVPNIETAMLMPITLYATIITGMTLFAINRHGSVSNSSFWMVTVGAVLFMMSDSMIAINQFYAPFESSRLLIMTTYITAQYLIAKGTIKLG